MPQRAQPTIAFRCIRLAGSGWLRPRLRTVPILCARFAVAARQEDGGARVTLDDGSERRVDHVLLGTGFQIDVARYPFLETELADELELVNGYPVLGAGLESSVPELHFIGAPAAYSFGPIMRFMAGTWYDAPALAERVLRRSPRRLRFSF